MKEGVFMNKHYREEIYEQIIEENKRIQEFVKEFAP